MASAGMPCPATLFQSTHPMRGATPISDSLGQRHYGISIHAPHEGCDVKWNGNEWKYEISIHAPHEGCDVDVPPPRVAGRNVNFNPRTP